MARFIGFSLGYLTEDMNSQKTKQLFGYFKRLKIQGIEMTFTKERLYSFKLNSGLQRKLEQFKYISIHAPFELVKESENGKEIIKQLDIIAELYKKIKAKRVIIHPDNLPSPDVLERYDFKVSTENLKKKRKITIPKLRKILNQYPQIGLCLDAVHAYSWSKHEADKLIKAFGNKITQVHLSASYRGKHHQPLGKASKDFLLSISPIKKLNAPIIIEEEIKRVNLKEIKDEIQYIRKFFSK